MLSKRYLQLLAVVATPIALGVVIHGCIGADDSGGFPFARAFQVTDAASAASLPKGPDAIGGLGSGGMDVGDYILANQLIRVVVDQPGIDPTSRLGMLPLTHGLAPSGGTLIDLASVETDNDQWNQMTQGIVGFVTNPLASGGGLDGSAIIAGAFNIFQSTGADFATDGVAINDTLVIATGLNVGSFKIGGVGVAAGLAANQIALFIPPGGTYVQELTGAIAFGITSTTSPIGNIVVYDSAAVVDTLGNALTGNAAVGQQVRLAVTGGITNLAGGMDPTTIPDGTTVDPATGRLASGGALITVTTTYRLFADTQYVTLGSVLTNTGGGNIGIFAMADLILTGGISVPNIVPWTPLLGHTSLGLDTTRIVAFTSFRGRDEPGVSYTHVDSITGQEIHATDGLTVAACIQLITPGLLAGGATISWNRNVCVGRTNDVASSADIAISLLANSLVRVNPADGSNIPNGYQNLSIISGVVANAPAGTMVTATQVDPALIFDPGQPAGGTAAAGFYPVTVLGFNELIITEARPEPTTGFFSMIVPRGFAGLGGTGHVAPSGLSNGTEEATYRVTVIAPGHNDQSVLVRLPAQASNNLNFDLQGETATIQVTVTDNSGTAIPVQVTIVGQDPDGAGPQPTTPNPVLGGPDATFRPDERAEGTNNVVHFLDGTGSFELPPGAYQLLISRGLEYSAARFPPPGSVLDFFLVSAGQTIVVDDGAGANIQLTRILDSMALNDPDTTAPAGTGTFDSFLRNYVSADFHVHAGGSFDSAVPLEDRVTSYLTSNVEIMVSTEHDNIVDLRPARNSLDAKTTQDLSLMVDSQIGVESTGFVGVNLPTPPTPFDLPYTNTIGHYGAWPMLFDPTLRRNGAPADEFRSPSDLYEDLRALGVGAIQLNHPRYPIADVPLPPIGLGYLTNAKPGFLQPNRTSASLMGGGYNTPLRSALSGGDDGINDINNTANSESGLTAFNDFDVFEVFGGETALYDAQKLDWFAMTSVGFVRTGTANSDSHSITGAPGFPRSFVFTSDTVDDSLDVSGLSTADFNDRMLPSLIQATKGATQPLLGNFFPAAPRAGAVTGAMNVLGSSGPVVLLEVDANQNGTFDGRPGSLVPTTGFASNTVDVRITVLAAPWVPVDSVQLIINGFSVAGPLTGNDAQFVDLTSGVADFTLLTDAKYPGAATGTPRFFSSAPADFVRVRATFTVTLTAISAAKRGDDWMIVEVRGVTNGSDPYDFLRPLGSIDSQTMPVTVNTAIGFTNPVFIDRSDNSVAGGAPNAIYDPPGVP